MSQATPIKAAKQRVDYIDIARVLAAFIIILYHSAIVGNSNYVYATAFLFGRLPFFFVLAGFFLRDPNWDSMRKRLALLLIPYLLWEYIPMIICYQSSLLPPEYQLSFGQLIERGLIHFPFNFPLWFLRDLIIYTALYPLLYPLRRYLWIVATILFILLTFNILPLQEFASVKHPCSIRDFAFYLCGISLQQVGLTRITQFFSTHWKKILILGGSANIIAYIILFTTGSIKNHCLLQMLGILTLLALSYMISKHGTWMKNILIKAAPASYLIFLSHALLYFPVKLMAATSFYQDYHYLINPSISILIIICASTAVSLMRQHTPKILPFIAGIRK